LKKIRVTQTSPLRRVVRGCFLFAICCAWAFPSLRQRSFPPKVHLPNSHKATASFTVLVTHLGIDNAELGALLDMNTNGGLPEMSGNRQGELNAITSQRFRDAVWVRNVRLLTYRELIAIQGLQSMRRPQG
jgi:hypothetical protein